MNLEVIHGACGYGKGLVIEDISLNVTNGDIVCLLGPNGAGKTTFFKTILGFLKLQKGEILLNGTNIDHWHRKKLAKVIGYVPQAHTPPFPFCVLDVVVMGRTPHLEMYSSPTKKDVEIAEEALLWLKISHLKDKNYTEISGGERQLVLIARALAQQPEILIMDEPTSNLDFGNQIRVLKQINQLSKRGLGILMTSHFPDHAFLCSTKAAFIQKDHHFKVGSADEIVTEENLKTAYGINVKIIDTWIDDQKCLKSCIPLLEE